MVLFTSKIPQSGKMSDQFYTFSHLYIQTELPKILKSDKELTLIPLSGGIMGATYQFTNPNDGMEMVIKVEDFDDVKYDSYLAHSVCKEYAIPHLNVLYFSTPTFQGLKLTVQILEKIDLMILGEYLDENPDSDEPIKEMARMLKLIHQKKTDGFGRFEEKSFAGKHSKLIDDLKGLAIRDEFKDFYISNNLLSDSEVNELCKRLDDPAELQGLKPVFCHGDIHLGNCFYDPKSGSAMLFDYSSKSLPAEFDLAIYMCKELPRGNPRRWEAFKEGYGMGNLDEGIVHLLAKYILFRKGVIWMQNGKEKRARWAIDYLKEFLAN